MLEAGEYFDGLLSRLSVAWLRGVGAATRAALLQYRGDLARYKQLCGDGDAALAESERFYLQAQCAAPASGKPHCQLAILSNLRHDGVDVVRRCSPTAGLDCAHGSCEPSVVWRCHLQVYRYCCGLLSQEPAPVARDNLLQVLERYRAMYAATENDPAIRVRFT